MLQLNNYSEQTSCPPALAKTPPKSSPPLILADTAVPDFVPLWEVLWNESARRRGQILKVLRSSKSNVFEQAKAAWKLAYEAQAALETLAESLPPNQKTETPTVRIRWSDDGVDEATDIDQIEQAFANWIAEVGADDQLRANFFRDRKRDAIDSLVATTKAVLETQRLNGLWKARVEGRAAERAAQLLTYNAYQFSPATLAECTEVTKFLAFMAHQAIEYSHDLNEHAMRGCCRRLTSSLQRLSRGKSR